MTHILVIGDSAYTDTLAVEKVLQHAYLTVRPLSEEPPYLQTMGAEGPERWAESWWSQHGLRVLPHRPIRHPYKHIHSLLGDYPNVFLIFGDTKFLRAAAEKAARHNIEPVIVED